MRSSSGQIISRDRAFAPKPRLSPGRSGVQLCVAFHLPNPKTELAPLPENRRLLLHLSAALWLAPLNSITSTIGRTLKGNFPFVKILTNAAFAITISIICCRLATMRIAPVPAGGALREGGKPAGRNQAMQKRGRSRRKRLAATVGTLLEWVIIAMGGVLSPGEPYPSGLSCDFCCLNGRANETRRLT